MEDRTHGGRVHHENEEALGNEIAEAQAEAALPGVFASGKKVIETSSWRDHNGMNLLLRFDDGSSMKFSGTFTVEAQAPGVADEGGMADLVEHGRQLMSGHLHDEDWQEGTATHEEGLDALETSRLEREDRDQ
jgi:hypothetical protein